MRRHRASRNEVLASLLCRLSADGIFGSGDQNRFLERRGEGVPTIYERTRRIAGVDPEFELVGGSELLVRLPASPRPKGELLGQVSLAASGVPLAGARVVVQYPNGTWLTERSNSFGRAAVSLHADLPMIVFCAAPGHRARVVRRWRATTELEIDLPLLEEGGSVVLTDGQGHLPGLCGRLCPILDDLDRMYLWASNIAIDGGKRQPVFFRLRQQLRLVDAYGSRRMVRFIDMAARSAILEYWPPAAPLVRSVVSDLGRVGG